MSTNSSLRVMQLGTAIVSQAQGALSVLVGSFALRVNNLTVEVESLRTPVPPSEQHHHRSITVVRCEPISCQTLTSNFPQGVNS